MKLSLLLLVIVPMLLTSFNSDLSVRSFDPKKNTVSRGIKFSNLTFEKALKQAKATNKMVFVDVYTTWCGPCKEMAATTFKDQEVGNVFNKRFICIKVDAENDESGPTIEKLYGVNAYPTLLFINSEGKMVRKLVGKQSKEKLLSTVSNLGK